MSLDSRWENINVLTINDIDSEAKEAVEDSEMEYKKFEVKNYIPKRSNEKFLKPLYISVVIVCILLIIIIATVISLKQKRVNLKQEDLLGHLTQGLILRDGGRVWSYDPQSGRVVSLVHEVKSNIDSVEFYAGKTLFWTEANATSLINSLTAGRRASDVMFQEARVRSQGMALDSASGNLYVVDEMTGLLVVINSQTKNHSLVLAELDKPHDIVLDPAEGLMFILQLSDSILRGNMDGRSLRKIIEHGGITTIAADTKAKRIYWVSDFVSIDSSDYLGSNRQTLLTDSMKIASLVILGDQLFWLWPTNEPINATLWSCRIHNNGTCEYHVVEPLISDSPIRNLTSIRAIVPFHRDAPKDSLQLSSTAAPMIKYACEVNNGDCQELCLAQPNGDRSCACQLGRQLNPDRRTCRTVTDFVLYTFDGHVRACILDPTVNDHVSVDVIWPTRYSTEALRVKPAVDFDYDMTNDAFYFSDEMRIYKMKLTGLGAAHGNQTAVLSNDQPFNYFVEDMAFDWLTGNLYYSLRSRTYNRNHKLLVLNTWEASGQLTKTLLEYNYDPVFGMQACPYAIAIDPSKGSLFYTAGDSSRRVIQRTGTNGTKISQFSGIPYVHEYRLLAVDYERDRLYWISESGTLTKVKHANLDGSDLKVLSVDTVRDAKTLYVHQQWLYISNQTGVWRVSKDTGGPITIRIAPRFQQDDRRRIDGVRVISAVVQAATARNNLCALDNGSCEQFCFSGPQSGCGCVDGKVLRNGFCI